MIRNGGFSVGRYLTVRRQGPRTSDAYLLVEQRSHDLVATPVLPGRTLPAPGEQVVCASAAGQWDARVRTSDGETVVLSLPEWVRRSRHRHALRVPIDAVTTLSLGHTTWWARLADISVTGAALVMEKGTPADVGLTLGCVLPQGNTHVEVRAVRAAEHPMLQVVGATWCDPDDTARQWIRDHVTAHRAKHVALAG